MVVLTGSCTKFVDKGTKNANTSVDGYTMVTIDVEFQHLNHSIQMHFMFTLQSTCHVNTNNGGVYCVSSI